MSTLFATHRAFNADSRHPHLVAMSDYSASPSDHHNEIQAPKRKATAAGLDGHGTGRSVKRRASKACQCCRARKVRCNVTEHGAPCTNCRLDEVECIVSESRRKKLVPHSRAISDVSTNKTLYRLINNFDMACSIDFVIQRRLGARYFWPSHLCCAAPITITESISANGC